MAESWELVHERASNSSISNNFMKHAVSKYFNGAFRACQKNPVITSHNVQGTRLRVALEKNTLDRYETEAILLINFAENCLQEKTAIVPNAVAERLESLHSADGEVDISVTRKIHALLFSLFLDVIEPRQGDVGFVAAYMACASIVGGPSKDMLRFGDASEISPVLAALKYCIRMVAVSEVVGIGETNTGAESWKLINERTAEALVDTGATHIVYLSHLAHSIIPSESTRCRFRICSRHQKCGYIDDAEISLERLGKVVLGIQEHGRTVMGHIWKGLIVGDAFCTEARRLDDALQNSTIIPAAVSACIGVYTHVRGLS
jgi:hypothetical protein